MAHTLVGGRVLDPVSGVDAVVDVAIDDAGVIAGVGPGTARMGAVVDVGGCWVLPGLVDVGVYAGEAGGDGSDGLAATASAALSGGYTTIALGPAMAGGVPRIDQPAMVQALRSRARHVPIRTAVIGAATRARELTDIAGMVRAGAAAIGDVGHGESAVANAALVRRAFEHVKTAGAVAICAPADEALRERGVATEGAIATRLGYRPDPAASEFIALARDLELAALVDLPLVVWGVTTKRSVELIAAARARGQRVTAFAFLHHILFDESALLAHPYDTKLRFSPPLRARTDVDAVLAGLASGVVDAIASGHVPLGQLAKEPEFEDAEPGALGLQTCVGAVCGLVARGALGLVRAVDALSLAPARALGLAAAGIGVGAPADLCVVDPAETWMVDPQSIGSWASNTPLWGQSLQGRVTLTVVGGEAHYDPHQLWRRQ